MIDQFVKFIQENQLFTKNQPLLVGVSGGIDSVVLVHLLKTWNANFSIAHCNFGLRGAESDADEIFVSALASSTGVPYFRKYFETEAFAKKNGLSIQMAARELRFAWFEELFSEHGFKSVVLGTHKSDSVETFLINLVRGTGLKGLTGVKPKRDHIVRPLLFASRDEIESYANKEELNWREDSSNSDVKYLRNKIRNELLPLLRELNENVDENIHQTSKHLLQSHRILQTVIEEFKRENTIHYGDQTIVEKAALEKQSDPMFFLYQILVEFGFNAEQVSAIWSASFDQSGKQIQSGRFATLFDRGKFIVHEIHQKNIGSFEIEKGQIELKTSLFKLHFRKERADLVEIHKESHFAYLDYDKLQFPLELREWEPGDVFVPLGMTGSKKLSDFLIDEKIPLNKKNQVYVLENNGKIAWVVGYRISNKFKLEKDTKNAYIVTVEPIN